MNEDAIEIFVMRRVERGVAAFNAIPDDIALCVLLLVGLQILVHAALWARISKL